MQAACIKEKKKLRVDEVFYQIGKGIWLPFLIIGFWFAFGGYDRYGEAIHCGIRELCGLPCPGCGGTRALYYLFRGNFVESLRLHPGVIYGVAAYLQFMALVFYRKHIAGTWEQKTVHLQRYLYAAIFVILLQWVIKIVHILYLVSMRL